MPARRTDVVVNAGPLIALDACGQIDILRQLHSRVIVPEAVASEVKRKPLELGAWPDWIEIHKVPNSPSAFLLAMLDLGEAQVIMLAGDLGCELAIIDERKGRSMARTVGIEVTGTLGLLLRAKRLRLLSQVRPCLSAMRVKGVWIADHLEQLVLREAGEG